MAENELIIIEELNPVEVYTPEGIEGVLKTIETKALSHVPNLETAAGRKDIASLAYKVARSKTILDDMGLKLAEDAKKRVKILDGHRKKIRDTLDTLKEKIRQPLTDWEAEEAAAQEEAERKDLEKAQERVNALAAVGVSLPFIQANEMDEDDFIAILKEASEAWEAEKQRIEAEKELRKLQAEADKKAREEEAAKMAAERAELDRQRAIIKAANDKIEADRRALELEQAKKEAAEKALKDAAEKAEREAREKAEAEKKEKDEAERKKAMQPDKDKLIEYAANIIACSSPGVFSDAAVAISIEAQRRLRLVNTYIIKAAQEL